MSRCLGTELGDDADHVALAHHARGRVEVLARGAVGLEAAPG